MRITNASRYAIQALVNMAGRQENAPAPSHEIARTEGIPERFLLKILKPLVSAGVLHSVRGPNGGYRLRRSPKEVTLLQIIEAVDGPIRGQYTDDGGNLSNKLAAVCDDAANDVRQRFGKVRLSDLTDQPSRRSRTA